MLLVVYISYSVPISQTKHKGHVRLVLYQSPAPPLPSFRIVWKALRTTITIVLVWYNFTTLTRFWYLTNKKHSPCWYTVISTRVEIGKTRNCVETRRSVFTHFRVFPISTSVDITVYQNGKNVLYLFYNIAQRNIKEEIFRRFCVDIELYQHGLRPISVQNLQMLYYKSY